MQFLCHTETLGNYVMYIPKPVTHIQAHTCTLVTHLEWKLELSMHRDLRVL